MTSSVPDRAALEKIKVTDAMIQAGRIAMERRWLEFTATSGFRLWDEVLTETFRAMWAAQMKRRSE